MMKEFINFLEELFPSVSPYIAEQAKNSMAQFNISEGSYSFYTKKIIEGPVQGDIIDRLNFISYDSNGNEISKICPGMILSNSCDIENKDNIIIAPFLDLTDFSKGVADSIKSNKKYSMFYLPNSYTKDKCIDLSLANSYNTEMINNLIKANKVRIVCSLNQLGYYILLCKLTVYLMRPEDTGVEKDREIC